jgi:hypothetical protein
LETALLRKSVFAHQSSKLLKREQALVEPFDANLLEKLLAVPDDEDLLIGINTEINILSDPVEIDIVASFGNAHRAILTNGCRTNVLHEWRRARRQDQPMREALVSLAREEKRHEAADCCR